VTAPAANVSTEDQRRQNGQTKKDESRVDESLLQRVHGLRGLDRGDRLTHEAPLNDMRDHDQIEKDQRQRAPPAGL